jgi:hypothetical protein
MKFRRESSMRMWAIGPAICISGLILGVSIDAPSLLLAAFSLFFTISLLAVEWVIFPADKMIVKRVTVAFFATVFQKKYRIADGYQLSLSITPRGTKTQDGDFISDYAKLELTSADDTLRLTEGTDVDRVTSIANSISKTLSIQIVTNESQA